MGRKGVPDPLWDTMIELFGYDTETINDDERGRLNKALKLLRQSQATPALMREYYRLAVADPFWGRALTAKAFASRWTEWKTRKDTPGSHRVEAPAGKYDD